MAAQISPRPIPVASQLLTPSKSGVSNSEPQKSTFQSELSNVASNTQSNDKVSVNNTDKNTDKVAKNQEVVEKSGSDSIANKKDSGVDDSVNNSSISAADTNVVRNDEQQNQNDDGLNKAPITAENSGVIADSSNSLNGVDEGKELPQTGVRLPPEAQGPVSAELENSSLLVNDPLPSLSSPAASILSTTDANLKAELPLTEPRVLPGQAALGAGLVDQSLASTAAELPLTEPRVLPGQAALGAGLVDPSLASTAAELPLTDNQLKANINVAGSAVSDAKNAINSSQVTNQPVVSDVVQQPVIPDQVSTAKADMTAVNVAAKLKLVASEQVTTPIADTTAINTSTKSQPIASVASETEVLKPEGQLISEQLNKTPIGESLISNTQSPDKTGQVESNMTRSELLVTDTRQPQSVQEGATLQASAAQTTVNTKIDGLTPVPQNEPALVSVQPSQGQADSLTNTPGQSQIINQGFEETIVNNENKPALNIAKDAALTAPSQGAVQMANISQERLNQQQSVSRDFKLEAASNAALTSSEQTVAKEAVKTNIVGDARFQMNQPAPLPMPVNTTPLTDNQTFALNQSLEQMRSGIDINSLNNQTDDASSVKNTVDKALVANEAVQQLSHLQNNLKTASPVQLQMPVATPPTAKNWGNAVADKVMIAASQNLRVANIQLDPPELGALQVRLHVTGPDQQMTVSFTSPHASVRDALEQNLPRLREMLEEQGINLGESSVNDQGKDDSNGGSNGQHSSLYADQDDAASINPLNTQGSLSLVDFYA